MVEHPLTDEAIVKNDVGRLQRAYGLQREQLRIAGASTHQQHAALGRTAVDGKLDRVGEQAAGLVLIAIEGGSRGRAIEHAFPELAAGATRRQPLGHAATKFRRKPGDRIKTRVQLALEPGTQALCEHRCGAGRADGHRHFAAIDDGRQRKAAQLRPVGNIDRHAERARDGCDACVLNLVPGGRDHQGPAAQLIDAGARGPHGDAAGSRKFGKLRYQGFDIGGNVDGGCALQQESHLDGRKLAAPHHERRLAVEIQKDGEAAHCR